MFLFDLLPNHEGPKIIAALEVWTQLRETVNKVANHSPLLQDSVPFRGLAGDARHVAEVNTEYFGVRHATEFVWPVLLIQAAMLRQSLAFFVHDKNDQAITYALEAVIEKALLEDFDAYAKDIIDAWQTVDINRFTEQRNIDEIAKPYFGWNKAQRAEHLNTLIGMPGWLED